MSKYEILEKKRVRLEKDLEKAKNNVQLWTEKVKEKEAELTQLEYEQVVLLLNQYNVPLSKLKEILDDQELKKQELLGVLDSKFIETQTDKPKEMIARTDDSYSTSDSFKESEQSM